MGLLPSQNQDTNQGSKVNSLANGKFNLSSQNIPDYLKCPICKNLMEMAVLAPCCGTSFCDSCIQDYLFHNDCICFECKENCSPDLLIPNVSLRKSILTFTGAPLDISSNQNGSTKVSKNQSILEI